MSNVVLLGLLVIAAVAQFYLFRFEESVEGRDERGKLVSYQTTKFLYNVLFSSITLLVVLQVLQIINAVQFVNILLYLVVSLSIFGAGYLSQKRKVK